MKKRALFLLLVCFAAGLLNAQGPEVLTNKDVVGLLEAGLSAEVVEAKIQTSKTKFDTSSEALKALNAARVPMRVIMAMLRAGQTVQKPEPAPAAQIAPIPEENQSAKDEAAKEVTVYVTRSGKKYHRDGCRHLAKSKSPMSLGQASQYYEPCSSCHPPVAPKDTASSTGAPVQQDSAYVPRNVSNTGVYQPRTVQVRGYYRKDGTYVRPYARRSRR